MILGRSIIFTMLCMFFSVHAFAQSVSVDIVNADMSAGDTYTTNSTYVASGGVCAADGAYYDISSTKYVILPLITLPSGFQTTAGTNTVIQLPFDAATPDDTDLRVNVAFNDGSGLSSYNTRAETYELDSAAFITFDTLTNAPASVTVPHGTISVSIAFQSWLGTTCLDNVGPYVLVNAGVDCSSVDCGSSYVGSTSTDSGDTSSYVDYGDPLEWAFDDGSSDFDFDSLVDDLADFACGDPFDFVAKKAGAGGLLAKILGYIKSIAASQLGLAEGTSLLNCKADVANEIAESAYTLQGQEYTVQQEQYQVQQNTYEGQTNVQNLPAAASYDAPLWDTSSSSYQGASVAAESTIQSLSDGIESDNMITSSARTNRLLVANVRMQAELSDRLLGTEAPASYNTSGGSLITEADAASDPNVEFAEGDYVGTSQRISTLAQDVEPDFEELVEVDDTEAEYTGTGSCLALGAEFPTGSGVDLAMAKMRWNAAQRLAASNLGNFICSIIDQPDRSTTDICLAEAIDFSELIGATGSADANNDLCIYGSDAPTWSVRVLDAMPLILLIFASISVLKRFI